MDSTINPLVSICIPTFNGETYIAQALDSALLQTYAPLEIVVSDDGSNDQTLAIIASFIPKTTIPIRIFNHVPQGIGANWNHCVKQAQGAYIKFLFQDDLLQPDCIEKMMPFMALDNHIGFVYCRRTFLFESKTPKIDAFINFYGNLHENWESLTIRQGIINGKVYLRDIALLNAPKNKIGEPITVLIKKECFNKVGFFNDTLQQTLDCEFWYRVMMHYNIGFIDAPLVAFRLHDQQASVTNKSKEIPDQDLLYKSYYKHLFWALHLKNKLKLLKRYHPIFKTLVTLKQKWHAK